MTRSISKRALTSALTLPLLLAMSGAAQSGETLLHSFVGGVDDGAFPFSTLAWDKAGNLYGNTIAGGIGPCSYNFIAGCGVAFALTRAGTGWKETILHKFTGGVDGSAPSGALSIDPGGNVYGTATGGGAFGNGVLFRLSPLQGGGWTEKVLHSFAAGTDGAYPSSALTFDAAGAIYGTTDFGGGLGPCQSSCGTVYKVANSNAAPETVLQRFDGSDGATPEYGGLTFDRAGNIFGVTLLGGKTSYGNVFELEKSHLQWKEKTLYDFTDSSHDGGLPTGGLTLDSAGNLYGTTTTSGSGPDCGAVFELVRSRHFAFNRLFAFNGSTGCEPFAGLTPDGTGGFYGTTYGGGQYNAGVLFDLSPARNGTWNETVVHSFGSCGVCDAYSIGAGVTLDRALNVYGAGEQGGSNDLGAVYEITRSSAVVSGKTHF